MSRILAFDYGLRRVGLAVTDPMQIIANSLDTVATSAIYDFIKNYCTREQVELFVVGYPFPHGHAANEITGHIDKFIQKLEQLYPEKKVVKVDESFTSKIAARTLAESGLGKKERQKKGNIDAISANLILQSYLEMKRI